MFTKEELQVLFQALANSTIQVGQAEDAVELLKKIERLSKEPATK